MLQPEAVQNDDEDNFFDLLSRFQSKRMDDQRCSLTSQGSLNNKENECDNNTKEAAVANGKLRDWDFGGKFYHVMDLFYRFIACNKQ